MKKRLLSAVLGMFVVANAHAYDLKILHINDHHSHLESDGRMDLMLAGKKTRVVAGGMPRVATLFKNLSNGTNNTLKLHAGDAITGTLYYTTTKGEADAAVMNQICFDAFAVGNHEFDAGDAGLVNFLDWLNPSNNPCGKPTPVLGANVVPEAGVSPLSPDANDSSKNYLKPYVIKEVNGEKIGIIGVVIANKTKNSSNPDDSTQFLDEVETAQKYIDELSTQGVGKIVVLSHYQYANEVKLAQALSGVDVVVGGDSHTLLGDGYNDLGLSSGGEYPTVVKNKDGDTACVVQAWQYATIVGELDVTFNGDVVSACSGTPHMPLADSFKRKNSDGDRVELEGTDRQAATEAVTTNKLLTIVEEDQAMKTVVEQYAAEVDNLKTHKIATASEDLCLERIPGQGYRNCTTDAPTLRGSDISGVVAHAFLNQSNRADIAIQNAGGVRTSITAGEYTTGMAYELLPFANTLVNLDMTGQQVKNVLEEALAYAYDGSTGAYPYGAGIRWTVNGAKMAGHRFDNIEVQSKADGTWSPIILDKLYTVVTNSYIASGKDGYLTFGTVAKDSSKIENTYLDYAQSFVDYVTKERTFGKLADNSYSTQNYETVYHAGRDVTGIWWDPSQSGRGVSLKDSLGGTTVYGALTTYRSDNSSTWYTLVGEWSDNTEATGTLQSCTGSPDGQEWQASKLNCTNRGVFTLNANDDNRLTLDYTFTGDTQKTLNLSSFIGGKAERQKYDNLYWDSNKNGQGIYLTSSTITQSRGIYPGIWYRYDASGNATWYYLDGRRNAENANISYDILRITLGSNTGEKVGTATFSSQKNNPSAGELSYTLNGVEGTLNLSGFDF